MPDANTFSSKGCDWCVGDCARLVGRQLHRSPKQSQGTLHCGQWHQCQDCGLCLYYKCENLKLLQMIILKALSTEEILEAMEM